MPANGVMSQRNWCSLSVSMLRNSPGNSFSLSRSLSLFLCLRPFGQTGRPDFLSPGESRLPSRGWKWGWSEGWGLGKTGSVVPEVAEPTIN
ncbi:unnamed protein product [Protopolystoma xenopodis]|uniref:Uncharacterized protein n=1 Tax=Protopolystoma xenopodis TaxID=117903 RepID=A0A3S5B360_9PLAT|nr:unnamed protein product [Protopolystoma xenopodis]